MPEQERLHIHEVEVGVSQEDDEIEEVSINLVYLNNKQLLITTDLEMQVSKNTVKIPYKIDTGTEGNLIPLYIFKRLGGHQSIEQLKRSIKKQHKTKNIQWDTNRTIGHVQCHYQIQNF